MADVGARLRAERERLRLSQDDFSALAGITRQTLGLAEGGKAPLKVSYLVCWAEAGADPAYVLTGTHAADRLDPDEGELLAGFARLAPPHRDAVAAIVDGLAGATARTAAAPKPALPSPPALARALEGVLEVYPDLRGAELAQALARHLPSVLGAAADALDQAEPAPARAGNQLPNRREPRPARRT